MKSVDKIKVIIVDSSANVRINLKKNLEKDKDIKVIRAVSTPEIALKWMSEQWPNVIIINVKLPSINWVPFINKVQNMGDTSFILFSSTPTDTIANLVHKKKLPIFEIIKKPDLNVLQYLKDNKNSFISSVKSASLSIKKNKKTVSKEKSKVIDKKLPHSTGLKVVPKFNADVILSAWNGKPVKVETEKIVAIGASSGGIKAIEKILLQLPASVPGIIIVQHLSEIHTPGLANRLNSACSMEVKEAEEGDKINAGRVLISPGDQHSLIKRTGKSYIVNLNKGPLVKRHKPSVDVLFRTAAIEGGKNILGIILTGMGDDGAEEMLTMHKAGSPTIAQNQKTCAVFGMPREAIKYGGVKKVLPLNKISEAIMQFYNGEFK